MGEIVAVVVSVVTLGGRGAGLLGHCRHLLPLHHRRRGVDSHAQDHQSDIVSKETPVESVATMSICSKV